MTCCKDRVSRKSFN